jgi:hypothetical protein
VDLARLRRARCCFLTESKGSKNIATLFHEEMYQRIAISENCERRTITKIEAAIKQLINKAVTGGPKSIQAMLISRGSWAA